MPFFNNLLITLPLSSPSTGLPVTTQRSTPIRVESRLPGGDDETGHAPTPTRAGMPVPTHGEPLVAQAETDPSCDLENLSLADIANGACEPPVDEPATDQASTLWGGMAVRSDPGLGEPFDAQHMHMFASTREVSPDVPMAVWLGGPLLMAALTATSKNSATGSDSLAGGGQLESDAPSAALLQGSAVDDSLVLDDAMLVDLAGSLAGAPTLAIDGGAGIDTLRLAGSLMTLDLTQVSDVASRVQSIEKIDLGLATAHNTLTLNAASVLALGETGTFNDTTFAVGLGGQVGKTQLVIDGSSAGVLNLSGAWLESSVTLSRGGETYAVYDSVDALAQLIVNTELTRNLG